MAAMKPNTNALASDCHRSGSWTSWVNPEKYAPAVTCWTSTLNT